MICQVPKALAQSTKATRPFFGKDGLGPRSCMMQASMAFVLLAAVVIGCGRGDGLQRVVLNGAVSYGGEPVTDGTILFVPCDGTTGPSTAVKIVDGRYRADSNGGIPLGTYRVEILAYRKNTAGRQPLGPAPQMNSSLHANAPQQYLPEKYNVRSQLKTTVEAGSKSATQDFVLDN